MNICNIAMNLGPYRKSTSMDRLRRYDNSRASVGLLLVVVGSRRRVSPCQFGICIDTALIPLSPRTELAFSHDALGGSEATVSSVGNQGLPLIILPYTLS